jgi:hypothetical protein
VEGDVDGKKSKGLSHGGHLRSYHSTVPVSGTQCAVLPEWFWPWGHLSVSRMEGREQNWRQPDQG